MKLHLYCILPASLLVVLQFIPVIRHRLILFHRVDGYIIVVLSLLSGAGVILICRHAFGGDYVIQVWSGALVILTTIGYIMAWINNLVALYTCSNASSLATATSCGSG